MCSALVVIFSNSERSRWPPPPEPNESYNRPHRLNSKSYNNKHIGARAHHSYSPLSLVLLLRIVLPRSWSSSRAPTSFFLLSCVRCSFFYLFIFFFGTDIMSEVYLFYVFLSNHILYVDFNLCEPFCGKMVALERCLIFLRIVALLFHSLWWRRNQMIWPLLHVANFNKMVSLYCVVQRTCPKTRKLLFPLWWFLPL